MVTISQVEMKMIETVSDIVLVMGPNRKEPWTRNQNDKESTLGFPPTTIVKFLKLRKSKVLAL
jgi:hypothetical protein